MTSQDTVLEQEHFGKKYFSSGNYSNYKEYALYWTPRAAEKIAKCLHNTASKKVLDIGPAFGYLISTLRNRYHIDARGLEFSQYARRHALKDAKPYIIQGSISNTAAFKQDTYGLIVCFDVLPYIPRNQVEKAIKNIVSWTSDYVFFSTVYKRSRYASQKINPDPARITLLSQEECREIFAKYKARFEGEFDAGTGGAIMVFRKRRARQRHGK